MADDATKTPETAGKPGFFRYPDETRTVVANGLLPIVNYGACVDLTFYTQQATVIPNGDLQIQAAICARLRLDVEMATILRDKLSEYLADLATAANQKPN